MGAGAPQLVPGAVRWRILSMAAGVVIMPGHAIFCAPSPNNRLPTLAASDDGLPAGGALMHCPLCLPTAPPPLAWSAQPAPAVALSFELRPIASIAPAVWRFAIPPVRAPPML